MASRRYGQQVRRTSLQDVEPSTDPLSTMASEEINESEESEDLESGCREQRNRESSPLHGPGTSSNLGDNLSPDDANPDDSSSRESSDDERGSTAFVRDTTDDSPAVAVQADDNRVDENEPPNMFRYVIGRACNNSKYWMFFFIFLFIYVMYLLREMFGFDVLLSDDPQLKAAKS